MLRDVGRAEELAQDAFVAALERWPETGIPDNPGAWLMSTAKHRAINLMRHAKLSARKGDEVGHAILVEKEAALPDLDAAFDENIGDDLLRLMFTAAHPVLSSEARVALTLRLLGGLTTEEIAHAFLVPESTVAQRVVRAETHPGRGPRPVRSPAGADFTARLSSILQVDLPILNEGYAASSGDDWLRPALCEDALRLGRILAELAPDQPEVHGLVALMEIQASRSLARVGPSGEPILAGGEPSALGPVAHPSRPRRARARRSTRRRPGPHRSRRPSLPATRAR